MRDGDGVPSWLVGRFLTTKMALVCAKGRTSRLSEDGSSEGEALKFVKDERLEEATWNLEGKKTERSRFGWHWH